MLGFPDRWVWDSWPVDDGAAHHLFYLQAARHGHPDGRHARASVGHAVSRDHTMPANPPPRSDPRTGSAAIIVPSMVRPVATTALGALEDRTATALAGFHFHLVKPVAMDVCLNTSTQLPHGQICQPYSLHLGLTWMGVEFFGVNLGGESRTILQDLPKKPAIEWPAQQNAAAPAGGHAHHDPAPPAREPGLRVRIK